MKATLIFDSVNDLLFSKWDESFIQRMKSFNEQVSTKETSKQAYLSTTVLLSILTIGEMTGQRRVTSFQ